MLAQHKEKFDNRSTLLRKKYNLCDIIYKICYSQKKEKGVLQAQSNSTHFRRKPPVVTSKP